MDGLEKEDEGKEEKRKMVRKTTECSYCGKIMGVTEVEGAKSGEDILSHSVCEKCLSGTKKEMEEFKKRHESI
jgi:ribosomal protein L32